MKEKGMKEKSMQVKSIKKKLLSLAMGAALGFSFTSANITAAAEYVMSPGDSLQIYVLGHEDISSHGTNDSAYNIRPDGRISFPLIGEVNTTGMTVEDFTATLEQRLSRYIIEPEVSVNVAKLGTTRVFVLGEVHKAGMYELTKSHRVLDAIGAAGGFSDKSAKKNLFIIRGGDENNIEKVNFNKFLKKGDLKENLVLNEGDCIYLTSNHKISFSRDIMPWISGYYYVDKINNDD